MVTKALSLLQEDKFKALNGDTLPYILKHLELDVIKAIADLNRDKKGFIKACMLARVDDTLKPFVDKPAEFRAQLRAMGAVVGGSLALELVMSMPWEANGMDIYVPKEKLVAMRRYLAVEEGYGVER